MKKIKEGIKIKSLTSCQYKDIFIIFAIDENGGFWEYRKDLETNEENWIQKLTPLNLWRKKTTTKN
jgi:hypothetical protein